MQHCAGPKSRADSETSNNSITRRFFFLPVLAPTQTTTAHSVRASKSSKLKQRDGLMKPATQSEMLGRWQWQTLPSSSTSSDLSEIIVAPSYINNDTLIYIKIKLSLVNWIRMDAGDRTLSVASRDKMEENLLFPAL